MILLTLTALLYGQRTLFVGTIPLNGKIPLQETFSLDLTLSSEFVFTQELGGKEFEVATYEFSSNSPDLQYEMKLSPGIASSLGSDVFAFRNITEEGLPSEGPPIPFSISLKDLDDESSLSAGDSRSMKKRVGTLVGSRYKERGSISMVFPTLDEGFHIEEFSSGLYEASILVEVLAN